MIEQHNARLTNRCELIIPVEQPDRIFINDDLIKRIRKYYEVFGCPTAEQIDRQNQRVMLNCRRENI